MKLIPYVFVFCMASTLSCSSDDDNNAIMQQLWINSARVSCTGVFEQQCYRVQTNEVINEADWELFYDSITGFDSQYEEGFIYRIVVRRESVSNPPADASSYTYTLIEILSKD